MLDFRITLDARNPAVHCFRQYRVEAGTDLFGIWVVEITYGRIGTAGHRGAMCSAMKRRHGTWPRAS